MPDSFWQSHRWTEPLSGNFHQKYSRCDDHTVSNGISSSILGSSQAVYAYKQAADKGICSGVTVGFQRIADKLGQMLGPLILGILFSFTRIKYGFGIIGVLFLTLPVLFLFIARR